MLSVQLTVCRDPYIVKREMMFDVISVGWRGGQTTMYIRQYIAIFTIYIVFCISIYIIYTGLAYIMAVIIFFLRIYIVAL